jgi:malate dehydrogenase (oxaloacetate-decarboxylating)(NADP+)
MKIAASLAISELARRDVEPEILKAYHLDKLEFGPDYVVPKPIDKRVCQWVAPAVARAAMECGAARKPIDLESYPNQLTRRLWK